jgi:Phasin protein
MANSRKPKKKQIKRSPSPQAPARKPIDAHLTMGAIADDRDVPVPTVDHISQQNVEIAEEALRYGGASADRMTAGANQKAPAADIPGEEANQEAPIPVRNAALQPPVFMSFFGGWFDFARDRQERYFAGIKALSQCRSPQDLIALQCTLMRDNIEAFLSYGLHLGQQTR